MYPKVSGSFGLWVKYLLCFNVSLILALMPQPEPSRTELRSR